MFDLNFDKAEFIGGGCRLTGVGDIHDPPVFAPVFGMFESVINPAEPIARRLGLKDLHGRRPGALRPGGRTKHDRRAHGLAVNREITGQVGIIRDRQDFVAAEHDLGPVQVLIPGAVGGPDLPIAAIRHMFGGDPGDPAGHTAFLVSAPVYEQHSVLDERGIAETRLIAVEQKRGVFPVGDKVQPFGSAVRIFPEGNRLAQDREIQCAGTDKHFLVK